MPNSLSQRIAEHAKTKAPTVAGKNRAAFLTVREEVKGALDDGWPIKTVWETLREEGKIEFGYDAFIRYVDRLIGPRKQRDSRCVTPHTSGDGQKQRRSRRAPWNRTRNPRLPLSIKP
jgi:hypothetical protein